MKNRGDFWAITPYFNLTDSSVRLANYHCFRKHLSVPLLAIEWNPDREFQLKNGDADMVLQLGGGDLMWQKERLLEIALARLPDHVKKIAWIDCDVLFQNLQWQDEAKERLAHCPVVQLFSEVAYVNQSDSLALVRSRPQDLGSVDPAAMPRRESFLAVMERLGESIVAYDLDRRFQPDPNKNYNIMSRPAYGFAWAARADFLRHTGIYSRFIMGGGDLLFSYGVSGLSRELIDNHKAAGWAFYGDCESYRQWASQAAEYCRRRLGFVGGRIFHLFHGTLEERQYKSRIDGLVPFALDLDRDIAAEPGQPWTWRRDREPLNQYFMKYLRGRNEDGCAPAAVPKSATGEG